MAKEFIYALTVLRTSYLRTMDRLKNSSSKYRIEPVAEIPAVLQWQRSSYILAILWTSYLRTMERFTFHQFCMEWCLFSLILVQRSLYPAVDRVTSIFTLPSSRSLSVDDSFMYCCSPYAESPIRSLLTLSCQVCSG